MDIGKVSQAVYDRSVYRPLKKAGCLDAQVRYGMDAFEAEGGSLLESVSCGPVGGICDPDVRMRIAEVVNNLAVEGADCKKCRIKTAILFPAGSAEYPEEKLKKLEKEIGETCARWGLRICGGHTECSDAVLRPVLSLSAEAPARSIADREGMKAPAPSIADREGVKAPSRSIADREGVKAPTPSIADREGVKAPTRSYAYSQGAKMPYQYFDGKSDLGASVDIIMAGYAGQAGSALLARNFRDELVKRFPPFLIDDAAALGE